MVEKIARALAAGIQPDTLEFFQAIGDSAEQNNITPTAHLGLFGPIRDRMSSDVQRLIARQQNHVDIAHELQKEQAKHINDPMYLKTLTALGMAIPPRPAIPGTPGTPDVETLQMPPIQSLGTQFFNANQTPTAAPASPSPPNLGVPSTTLQPGPMGQPGMISPLAPPTPNGLYPDMRHAPVSATLQGTGTPGTPGTPAQPWNVMGQAITDPRQLAALQAQRIDPAHASALVANVAQRYEGTQEKVIPSETLAKMYPEIAAEEWNSVKGWPAAMVTQKLALYKQETAIDAKVERLTTYADLRREMADRIDGRQASVLTLRKDLQTGRLTVQEMNKGLSPEGATRLTRYLNATPAELMRMKSDGSLDQLQAEMKGVSAKAQSNAASLRQQGFELKYGKDVRDQVSKVQQEARMVSTSVDPKTGVQIVDTGKMADYIDGVSGASSLLHPAAVEELKKHAHFLKQEWIPTPRPQSPAAPAAPVPAPHAPGALPTYKDFDKLKSGDIFTAPDGTQRKKK